METIEPNTDKNTYSGNTKSKHEMSWTVDTEFDQVMNCPICGFFCTHFTDLEVYARQEDEKTVTKVSTDLYSGKTTIETIEGHADNPSARRHGQILKGYCESGCNFNIEISQHKGNTFFRPEHTGHNEVTYPKNR